MTRRKKKKAQLLHRSYRNERITKLIARGWIGQADEIPQDAIPVDPDRINLGGSYFHPTCFQDQPFVCRDCGEACVWKAEDQRWYFEATLAPYYSTAVRCRPCRRVERERKVEARRRAGHEPDEQNERISL